MKILIVGSGAMGCRFGVHFLDGGADVVLYDVWQEHVDAINRDGLKITEKGEVRTVRIPAVTKIQDVGKVDGIVLLTKSSQTESALKESLPAMGDKTVVMSVQNGIGNFDIIEEMIGKDRMIIGCTLTATTLTCPGEIRIDSAAHSDIQALGKIAIESFDEICGILERGGMDVGISENVLKEIWQKLSFNAAMNPITGITRLVVGRTGQTGVDLASLISEEVCQVAEAEGIPIDRSFALNTFHFAALPGPRQDMTHLTSMLQDVVKERKTEAESICGAVIRRAKKHGIPIPHLETVYSLVQIIESNYPYQLSPQNPDPVLIKQD